MTYNMADTIYYKSAKRLLHTGLKMLSPEKIKQLSLTVKCINEVSPDLLGLQARTGQHLVEYQFPLSPRKAESGDENCPSRDHPSPKLKPISNMPEYVKQFFSSENQFFYTAIVLRTRQG